MEGSPVANKVWTTVVEPASASKFGGYKEARTDSWPYFTEDRPRTEGEVEERELARRNTRNIHQGARMDELMPSR